MKFCGLILNESPLGKGKNLEDDGFSLAELSISYRRCNVHHFLFRPIIAVEDLH